MGRWKTNKNFFIHRRLHWGTLRLFDSDYADPINIGSDEQVSINEMIGLIENISGIEKLNKEY